MNGHQTGIHSHSNLKASKYNEHPPTDDGNDKNMISKQMKYLSMDPAAVPNSE
jgi:hypothetical protein